MTTLQELHEALHLCGDLVDINEQAWPEHWEALGYDVTGYDKQRDLMCSLAEDHEGDHHDEFLDLYWV